MTAPGLGARAVPERAGVSGWTLAALLTGVQLSAASDRFLVTLVTAPVKQALALSDAELGFLLGSAFVVLYALTMPLFGTLADRGHQRRILLGSLLVWTLATLGFGLAGSFAALALARLVLGLGQAGLAPAVLSLIAHHSERRRMGLAVSLFTAAGSLGQSFALLSGGALFAWLTARGGAWFPGLGPLPPWRALFVLACLPNLALILFAASIRLPPTPPVTRPRLGTAFAWILRRRSIYLPHFAAAAAAVLMGRTLAAWGPTFYVRNHGMSPGESGVTLGLLLLVGGPLGHLFAGLILDRLAPERRRPAASWMLGLGLVLALPLVGVMALAPGQTISLGAYALLVATLGFTSPAALTGVQWLTPVALRGRVNALFIAAVTLTASGTGPLILGLLADTVFGADHLGRAMIALFLCVGGAGAGFAALAARGRQASARPIHARA
ncbi:MFS transporter [Methylobacterium sp. J-068]|uniref:MFS transporter n=1 Tax=Methylobacterium sp. J-068 TaxID=2836649 RepID=UPI001FB968A6|nr:MFS transporter [Methylobacterium sp. J-068]MCJ2037045.1 MFS transporter [Methylobacterium sp. J-068]